MSMRKAPSPANKSLKINHINLKRCLYFFKKKASHDFKLLVLNNESYFIGKYTRGCFKNLVCPSALDRTLNRAAFVSRSCDGRLDINRGTIVLAEKVAQKCGRINSR